MRRPRVRQVQGLVLGLLLAGLGVLALVFGVGQLQGVVLSDAVQHDGALATAYTVRVVGTGSHGGAELEVRFTTARGQHVRTRLWDGASDAVHVRTTLAVRYLTDRPTEAEPDGQPFNTAGQAVLDLVLAVLLLGAAILLLLAALGFTPLARLGRALRRRADRRRTSRPVT
jgi:hypothetical protein